MKKNVRFLTGLLILITFMFVGCVPGQESVFYQAGGKVKNLDPGYIDGEIGKPQMGQGSKNVSPLRSISNPSNRIARSGGFTQDNTEQGSDIAQRLMSRLNRNASRAKIITFHVVGIGIAPENARSKGEALIMGQNAARSDGYVKLVERIHGVYVDSYRRLGRGAINQEVVHMETQAWLKGAEVLEYKEKKYGLFEAHIRLRIKVNPGHALYETNVQG
ncbi:MAG: hypothetical protein GY714_30185 [Desulfobacterales bacterium]|nr:hypothetical protein [Desulfobacterales bacterium]